jgi:nicotinamide-nucleotide amidase
MQDLLPLGEKIGARLKARKETLVVAESSTGGLISAALLAVPGASSYFIGGSTFYTRQSFLSLRETREDMFTGMRGCTEAWALLLARTLRARCGATWAIGESGAAGPSGNKYGDPSGVSWVVVTGPVERTLKIETGASDRVANMRAFAAAALKLFDDGL